MKETIELANCIRALLLWKNEYGAIRDSNGSRNQIALVQQALAEYELMDEKMREADRLGG